MSHTAGAITRHLRTIRLHQENDRECRRPMAAVNLMTKNKGMVLSVHTQRHITLGEAKARLSHMGQNRLLAPTLIIRTNINGPTLRPPHLHTSHRTQICQATLLLQPRSIRSLRLGRLSSTSSPTIPICSTDRFPSSVIRSHQYAQIR